MAQIADATLVALVCAFTKYNIGTFCASAGEFARGGSDEAVTLATRAGPGMCAWCEKLLMVDISIVLVRTDTLNWKFYTGQLAASYTFLILQSHEELQNTRLEPLLDSQRQELSLLFTWQPEDEIVRSLFWADAGVRLTEFEKGGSLYDGVDSTGKYCACRTEDTLHRA